MSKIEKLAAAIVREMDLIDLGLSDGRKLDKLTDRYIAAQRKIDQMRA